MKQTLSVIVPCYCEEESIFLFYKAVEKEKKKLKNIELEYWFIDDGSKDNTLLKLYKLQRIDPKHVHYASFSRNFGKEAALYCGLKQSTGDYVVVMDADLQDPPELLPIMMNLIRNDDYSCIGTKRINRKGEPPIRLFFSNLFYKIINKISDTPIINGVRDYRLMTRQMVDAILSIPEYNRFSKGIFSWVGFKTKYLEYSNKKRIAGKSSWDFWKLWRYSIDGIISFSQIPLNIASYVGIISAIGSIIGIIIVIIRKLMYNDSAFGWASLVCILLFIGGIQLLCLGILGKYIGKIYTEVKRRPIYILKEIK